MNNMLKRLLVAALAISASHLSAHTNKNFLSVPRPQHASLLLDSHITRDLASTKGHDRFGGNFLVSGYYSESTGNKNGLGKYFGVNDKASFKAGWGTIANNQFGDVNAGFLVHDAEADAGLQVGASTSFATINLAPKTTSYGLEFAYVQCLGKILDGLHLSISLPVERVENNMGLSVTNAAGNGNTTAARVTSSLQDFFAGNLGTGAIVNGPISNQVNTGGQAKLAKALFKGKQNATGIADIDVILGYDFIRNADWKAGLNIGLVIPTGNTPNGQYVFEPIYGNGGHWELGFGGRVDGRLWHDGHQAIELHLSADYRYGFQANETRTLGAKLNNNAVNWGQYFLAGVVGTPTAGEASLANTFTVPVSVTPNSALRGNIGLEYDNGGFLFGVHYAPAWKQAESGNANPTVAANLAVVAPDVLTNAGGGNIVLGAATAVAFTSANLDVSQALRPSQVSHRLGADMGYTFAEWEYPVTIGVGGHYEFAGDNASVENWGVNLKAGIGF